MPPLVRLYRVIVEDEGRNTADVLVSAPSAKLAGTLAVSEVNSYHAPVWSEGAPWRVSGRRDAVVELELAPPRVHAVVPGWD
jgi:hypothetical protein